MAEETPTMTVEETLRSVIAAAKAGRFSKVAGTPEGTNSWTIEAPTGTFVVENINRTSKTARLLGGESVTDNIMQAAREMLNK